MFGPILEDLYKRLEDALSDGYEYNIIELIVDEKERFGYALTEIYGKQCLLYFDSSTNKWMFIQEG